MTIAQPWTVSSTPQHHATSVTTLRRQHVRWVEYTDALVEPIKAEVGRCARFRARSAIDARVEAVANERAAGRLRHEHPLHLTDAVAEAAQGLPSGYASSRRPPEWPPY